MNIGLYLRNATESTPQAIFAIFRVEGTRYKIDTNKKILPKFWTKKQCANSKYIHQSEFNQFLKEFKDQIERIVFDQQRQKLRVYEDVLQNELNKHFNSGNIVITKDGVTDFMSFMDHYISTKTDKSNATRSALRQGKANVILAFNLATKQSTKEWESLRHRHGKCEEILIVEKRLEFSQINYKFMEHFKQHLLSYQYTFLKDGIEVKQHYKKNYVAKHIKKIKEFINAAVISGHIKDLTYKAVKAEWEDSDSVFTDWTEIENLRNLNLSESPGQEKTRDLYVFNCYLGLRYSDLSKLDAHDFEKKNNFIFVKVRQQKTDGLIYFPIHPKAAVILEQYQYKLPKLSDTNYNLYLKEICKKAGMTGLEKIRETRGGVKTFRNIPKYELIASHTGRRSFATNFYMDDYSPKKIMKITGHKSEKDFVKYINKKADNDFSEFLDRWGSDAIKC